MQQSLADMTLALRVLGALTEKQPPKVEDVKALRDLVPDAAGMSIDELACEVIQRALRHRAAVRKASR